MFLSALQPSVPLSDKKRERKEKNGRTFLVGAKGKADRVNEK
jgi:hypothetical protein